MNANVQAQVHAQPIIVRANGVTPAVFLLDSLDLNTSTIKVWNAGDNEPLRTVNLDYYRTSRPLQAADESAIIAKYLKVFSPTGGVTLRRRLFKDASKAYGAIHPREGASEPVSDPVSQFEQHLKEAGAVQTFDKAAYVAKVMDALAKAFVAAMQEAAKEA